MKLRTRMALSGLGILATPVAVVMVMTFYEMWAQSSNTSGVFISADTPDGGVEWIARKVRLDPQRWKYVESAGGPIHAPIGSSGTPASDKLYELSVSAAVLRPSTAEYVPTDAEFDDWLALPDTHEFATDLDGYVGSVR